MNWETKCEIVNEDLPLAACLILSPNLRLKNVKVSSWDPYIFQSNIVNTQRYAIYGVSTTETLNRWHAINCISLGIQEYDIFGQYRSLTA